MEDNHSRLTYEDFRRRAGDRNRSPNEKIGFPDSYRAGSEEAILADVVSKLPALQGTGKIVVDIGCGCGPLANLLMSYCAAHSHRLILVDSSEMLSALKPSPGAEHRPHRFPNDHAFLKEFRAAVDAILLYSVIQHEFLDGNLWGMLDAVCKLLADGGGALLGDIPNRSMRSRLFHTQSGREFHRAFSGSKTEPPIPPYGLYPGEIDDAVVFSLLMRARGQGVHAYVTPQPSGLPFFNRREDIILRRP